MTPEELRAEIESRLEYFAPARGAGVRRRDADRAMGRPSTLELLYRRLGLNG